MERKIIACFCYSSVIPMEREDQVSWKGTWEMDTRYILFPYLGKIGSGKNSSQIVKPSQRLIGENTKQWPEKQHSECWMLPGVTALGGRPRREPKVGGIAMERKFRTIWRGTLAKMRHP